MLLSGIKGPMERNIIQYVTITISIWVMVVGIYFFKFPNHFAFGGVTGFSTVIEALTGISAASFTLVVNTGLLVMGCVFLGRDVGVKTIYASMLVSLSLAFLERVYPMHAPLTSEPLLELVFAVFLPGLSSAVLFNIGTSSGGTDIIAMILKKYVSMDIGTALLLVDVTAAALALFVFGPTTGLFSILGLMAKSLVIDDVIENMNRCKCFSIICSEPGPICDFIIHELHRGATVYQAEGAYSHDKKTVILATMKRGQAVKLRNFIHRTEPDAFLLISNSSEIIGKGFLTN